MVTISCVLHTGRLHSGRRRDASDPCGERGCPPIERECRGRTSDIDAAVPHSPLQDGEMQRLAAGLPDGPTMPSGPGENFSFALLVSTLVPVGLHHHHPSAIFTTDPKWRFFWRVGERPTECATEYAELNAAPVLPVRFLGCACSRAVPHQTMISRHHSPSGKE